MTSFTEKDTHRAQLLSALQSYGFTPESLRHLSTPSLERVLACHEPLQDNTHVKM